MTLLWIAFLFGLNRKWNLDKLVHIRFNHFPQKWLGNHEDEDQVNKSHGHNMAYNDEHEASWSQKPIEWWAIRVHVELWIQNEAIHWPANVKQIYHHEGQDVKAAVDCMKRDFDFQRMKYVAPCSDRSLVSTHHRKTKDGNKWHKYVLSVEPMPEYLLAH